MEAGFSRMTPDETLVRRSLIFACCFDGYEPRLAQIVIETIGEQDELTLSVMMKFMADMAREEMSLN